MRKNIGKNISKNWSSKCSQKLLDHAKQSAADTLKTASKKINPKRAKATGDLIDNKFGDGFTKVSKTSAQNNSVTTEGENIGLDREINRERYISSEQRQRIIDDLRLKY